VGRFSRGPFEDVNISLFFFIEERVVGTERPWQQGVGGKGVSHIRGGAETWDWKEKGGVVKEGER